jgi:hypothetical protein
MMAYIIPVVKHYLISDVKYIVRLILLAQCLSRGVSTTTAAQHSGWLTAHYGHTAKHCSTLYCRGVPSPHLPKSLSPPTISFLLENLLGGIA